MYACMYICESVETVLVFESAVSKIRLVARNKFTPSICCGQFEILTVSMLLSVQKINAIFFLYVSIVP
jgi:hypothetical protein